MTIRQWLIDRIRDDDKHAEIDEREERTMQAIRKLEESVERNGFGKIFDVATHPPQEGRP
jgi:hypothetical protein